MTRGPDIAKKRNLPIRLVHVGASPAARGGIATVIANLLRAQEHDPDVLAAAIPTTMAQEWGVFRNSLLFARALFRIARVCATRPKPVLELHLASRGSVIRKAMIIRLANGCGASCIVHDHAIGRAYQRASPRFQSWFRGVFRRAAAIVSITRQETRFLASLGFTNAVTVANPVEIPVQGERLDSAPGEAVAFLSMGEITQRKGSFDLLEAFAVLRREGLPCRLTLAGFGDIETVQAWVRDHALEDAVDLPGWVVGETKTRLLREADVFVHPTHYDQLPVAVLEAMAFGLPVIATIEGGIPDAVADGETGLLLRVGDVDGLADRMRRLAQDAHLRARFGAAGRKKAETEFSLDSVARSLKRVYFRVAGLERD